MAVKLGNGNWAVKENKLLAYNDNSGRFFNKEFDFSRGSSATYVGKDGLIKTSDLQSTNLVQNGNFSELSSELVTNGDFSNGGTGWLKSGEADRSLGKIISTSGSLSSLTQVILTLGKRYKLQFEITDNTNGSIKVGSQNGGLDIDASVNSLGIHTYIFTSLGTYISFAREGGITDITIDNVSVKEVDPNDNWTLGTGWSFGDNKAVCDGSDGVNMFQNGVIENLKKYKISFSILNYVSGFLNGRIGSANSNDFTVSSDGNYSFNIISDGTNLIFRSSSFNGSITNISVQEIKTNTPRIDFSDSTNGALLLEGQSTNLIPYSSDFTNSFWLIQNLSVTLNGIISPNGNLNATKLIENTSNSTHRILNSSGLTVSGNISMSVFAKKGERNWIRLANNNLQGAFFDLDNGILGAVVFGITAKIENYGNGWYRCSISQTGVANERLAIYTSIDGVNTTYQGDGTSGVYIYGAQLEQGSYATSYIPTSGSATTRLADVCNNSGSAQDFNSEEGVLYAEIEALTSTQATTIMISISNGSTNAIKFGYQQGANVFFVESTGTANGIGIYSEPINPLTYSKVALSYKENDVKLYINGVLEAIDTSFTAFAPDILNTLNFDSGTGANNFYGNVKDLQVFTEALTDEQLAALTTI